MRTFAVVLFIITQVALERSLAQDAANGAKLFISCAKCHGEKGEGNPEVKGPKLAGQFDWYIQTQLTAFKSGSRKYKNEASCAAGLSEKDMADVAAHVKSL
jgi:cytochrome c553